MAWCENSLLGESITLDQYLDLGHVVVRFGQQRVPAYDEWFLSRFGHARRIEVVTTSFSSILQLVVDTTRIATVQQRLASFYAKYLPLKFVVPPIEMPVLTEAIVWHKYRDQNPGNTWVRRMLGMAIDGKAL